MGQTRIYSNDHVVLCMCVALAAPLHLLHQDYGGFIKTTSFFKKDQQKIIKKYHGQVNKKYLSEQDLWYSRLHLSNTPVML